MATSTPVKVVNYGPILEYVQQGADVDIEAFPTPRWHTGDGGRYIGTADNVITRDPDMKISIRRT